MRFSNLRQGCRRSSDVYCYIFYGMKKENVSPDILITTYNHYINNSLTKVLGGMMLLEKCIQKNGSDENLKIINKMRDGLDEVVEFLHLIRDVENVEVKEYVDGYQYIHIEKK